MGRTGGRRLCACPARAEDGEQTESDEAQGHGREQKASVRLMSEIEERAGEAAFAHRIEMPRRSDQRASDDPEHESAECDPEPAEPERESLLARAHALGLEISLEAAAQSFDDFRDPCASDPAQTEDSHDPRPE